MHCISLKRSAPAAWICSQATWKKTQCLSCQIVDFSQRLTILSCFVVIPWMPHVFVLWGRGSGQWKNIWMVCCVPVSDSNIPKFDAECPHECLRLAKVWGVRGLLSLFEQPVRPGLYSRVFNAFKDPQRDRQIGDRRLPNLSEYHVDGPSKQLPTGAQLTCLHVPRFTHVLRASVTDRRDFYHQACVTRERAQSNMLPFKYPLKMFEGMRAVDDLEAFTFQAGSSSREVVGDKLGEDLPKGGSRRKKILAAEIYPCFLPCFRGTTLELNLP
eukprot:s675_g42.t1